MHDSAGGPERDDPGGPGSELGRLHREAQEWTVLALGGDTVGPLSPEALVRTWTYLQGRGLGSRMSAYAITAHGRTVYLLGPHYGECPRGVSLEGHRATFRGADERGHPLVLKGLPCGRVTCYLFVTRGL